MTSQALQHPSSPVESPAFEGGDPGFFARLHNLGRRQERSGLLAGLLLAVVLHASSGGAALVSYSEIGAFARDVQARAAAILLSTYDIETIPPEPEPEAEPPVEEEAPEPEPVPEPELVNPDPIPSEAAPAPAAAEAGQVLTATPDPNEPLDLTDQGFLSGAGTRFAGGVTAKDGSSSKAVTNTGATGSGVPKGAGNANADSSGVGAVDRSRPAGLSLSANWANCPFPAEADAEQINQAVVRLVVVVAATGRPSSVTVVSDPGYGFGRAAQRCALGKTYETGLDQAGRPTSKATPPFKVRFQR